MNFVKTIIVAIVALFGATFAQATDLTAMSDAERTSFQAEVRAYLLSNPEVILEAIQVLEERQAVAEAQGDAQLVEANFEELVNDGYSWVGGNPDGSITVVEFSDYRCAFCKRAHPEVLALLEANDDVRLVMKEFPILGPDSTMASKAALSILVNQGDEVYEKFHDLLMTHNGAVNINNLSRLAVEAGGDGDLMEAHMEDQVIAQMIAKNHALGQRMNISGTPSFLIGTEMLRGFVPVAGMQTMVDNARAQLQ